MRSMTIIVSKKPFLACLDSRNPDLRQLTERRERRLMVPKLFEIGVIQCRSPPLCTFSLQRVATARTALPRPPLEYFFTSQCIFLTDDPPRPFSLVGEVQTGRCV